jgi:hypothetical protein
MTRLATVFATVLLAVGQAGASIRVAVVASRGTDVGRVAPLVEFRLGQNKEVVLLEREKIAEIFREQELGALLTAEGTAKRIALGKLLKADLLVLVQGQEKPQPYARVTICETKQGLRLCNQPVEFSKSIEADADAVLRVVEKAIEKQRRPIDDIVAVPPFVNNTLAYEGDHLKGACARLIEELLMDRPGVLVVELAEAKAIAQELTVGGGGTVQRRLPLYLMGEYRLEGAGEKKTVSFKLALLRGSTQVDARTHESATVQDFPKQVRDAATDIFSKMLGQAVKPPDPKAEVEQLAERADVSLRLGNWDEALALTEAALLVKPDRSDLHAEALALIDRMVSEEDRQEYREFAKKQSWPYRPRRPLGKQLLPAYLWHLENCLRSNCLNPRRPLPLSVFNGARRQLIETRNQAEYDRAIVEYETIMAMCRRVWVAKSAAKAEDPFVVRLILYMDPPVPRQATDLGPDWQEGFRTKRLNELFHRRLKYLQDFAIFAPAGCVEAVLVIDDHLTEEPAYLEYLRNVAELSSPPVHAAAENKLRATLNYIAERKAKESLEVPTEERLRQLRASTGERRGLPGPAQGQLAREAVFHPLNLHGGWPRPYSGNRLTRCVPLVAGIDLFLAGSEVYLMKTKDELRGLPWKAAARGVNICFDGQYLWCISADPGRCLTVLDPQTEQTWKLTADGGLPPVGGKENVYGDRDPNAGGAVAPLAPGKVCVAGWFGRTWCASASLDRKSGVSLRVFHEARNVMGRRGQDAPAANDPSVATPIEFMATLSLPAKLDKPGEQRVLLGGHGVWLIDPQKWAVEKVVDGIGFQKQVFVHDGALYWVSSQMPDELRRKVFPDLKTERIQPRARFGSCAIHEGRIYTWNGRLCGASSFQEEFQPLRGKLPDDEGIEAVWYSNLDPSQHYGLVLMSPRRVYRIELRTP